VLALSEEYLSLTVRSKPAENEAAFKTRLSHFWTVMLRDHKLEFEKVYAETVKFGSEDGCLTRQYLFESSIADLLEQQLLKADVEHHAIDRDDVYSKFEATPPEWMWIEH
jgi:hypothetical protein